MNFNASVNHINKNKKLFQRISSSFVNDKEGQSGNTNGKIAGINKSAYGGLMNRDKLNSS